MNLNPIKHHWDQIDSGPYTPPKNPKNSPNSVSCSCGTIKYIFAIFSMNRISAWYLITALQFDTSPIQTYVTFFLAIFCCFFKLDAHYFGAVNHFRFIGLPSEDEWPQNSPVTYSLNLGPKNPHPQVLLSLKPDERDLLLVSCSKCHPGKRKSGSAEYLYYNFFFFLMDVVRQIPADMQHLH